MLNGPFSAWPSFDCDEIRAVTNVLKSNRVNYWTGQECREFEREFAKWSNCKHAVAVANGTLALDLALTGLRIGSHNGGSSCDEVIVTPRTFLASVSTVVSAGATPVFADVNRDSGNMDEQTINAVLTEKTRAIIVVHLAGWPCDMDPIMDLANTHNIKVIEDCAQAHGATYKGCPVGSIGHVGAWSFCQDKIMTTGGEGGMVTTNDKALWLHMWSYKDHGKNWESVYERVHPPGFKWLHNGFGTNWRMLEIQATIGRLQLRKMASWSESRKHNASKIEMALKPFAGKNGIIRIPTFDASNSSMDSVSQHAFYKYYCYVRPENITQNWSRDRIVNEISRCGVPCFQGSCSEVYLEKAFDNTNFRPLQKLEIAHELGETSLMFLVHPTLTTEELNKTTRCISEILSKATTLRSGFIS